MLFLMGKKVFWGSFTLILLACLYILLDFFILVPDFTQMRKKVEVPIRLANGDPSTRWIGPEAMGWVSLGQISKNASGAVIASEDTAFYSHEGIDLHEIKQAIKKDLEEGKFARGASTLTQQVLKNVYLGSQKSLWRKIKEILWAPKLEKALTKNEILCFYLNMAEWGPGLYGIREAAYHYFKVRPSELSARQGAFLAMLLPSPRRYHAYFSTKTLTQWASRRINKILTVMYSMKSLDEVGYEVAIHDVLWDGKVTTDGPEDPGESATETPEEFFENTLAIGKTEKRNSTPIPKVETKTEPKADFIPESAPEASPENPVVPKPEDEAAVD